ncbi:MAG: GH25 family lysozyme [Porcipelethomonas sp.]
MRKKHFIIYILGLCLLSGCGQPIGQEPCPSDDALAAMAASGTEASEEALQETDVTPCTEPPEGIVFDAAEVEVYDEITVSQLVTDPGIQLKNGDEVIDTGKTGNFDVTVSYVYEDRLYEHPFSYTVADTTPPVLLNSGNYSVAETGSYFDLNDYVGFADNYDRTPTLTYEGYVDTSVCGIYTITATVTDSSGNETSWDLNIEVADEIPVPEDNNTRIAFDGFTQQYAGDNMSYGIDVSKWQGDIDFEAVKNAGCSFVIMRIGHYYDEIGMDEYYKENMSAAKEAGLDVGVYIYTTASSEEEVKENARWIADQLDGQELDFPVVFDWEDFSNFQQYEMSIHDLNEYFELFASEMEKYGYSSMLYSSKNFLDNFWYEQKEYPVWLAHYTDETDYAGEYAMWQMSCFGRIDGIEGDVDFNILFTDKIRN